MSSDEKERKEKLDIHKSKSTDTSEKFKKQSSEDSPLYYGVCLYTLNGPSLKGNGDALVFCDKKEALQTVKEHSGARFKVFASREDAANFSRSSCSTPRSLDLSIQDSPLIPRPVVGEKPSSFKAPRSQDMVKLRKAIESGDAEYFSKVVWANPRYLVSCGDTPAILQEGFRYNALHVSAKHNQGSMCSLILSTLEDPAFLPMMYSDDTPQVTQQRRKFIVDFYINMPEKGLCETPLHFACKFGCLKVAEILLRHPFCNTKCQNKYGKIPREIICDRNGGAEVKKQIEACFEATYYVPILRSEDNSVQGTVGLPYCLSQSLVEQPSSPINPCLSIKARAGPMTSKEADVFYRKWRMSSFTSNLRKKFDEDVRRKDSRKGLERIGRALASEINVPWSEYWMFLDDWTDLASSEGLQKLENHLKNVYYKIQMQNSSKNEEDKESSQDLEKSEVMSPVSLLCRQLEGFHLNSSPLNTSPDTPALFATNRSYSESSFDSSSLSNSTLGSPELRSRLGFFQTQNKKFNFKSSTPTLACDVSPAILASSKPRRGNSRCFDLICSYLVSFITDTVNVSDSNHLSLVSESILPIFERYFSNQIDLEEISSFHIDIAMEVVRRLDEELLQQREIVLAFNQCDVSLLQNNNDDSSSDDEQPARNLYSQQCKLTKQSILRNHVRCVLNQIKNLMDNQKLKKCDVKCQCSWDYLIKLKDMEKEKLNGSDGENLEESSEEEFFTPPSSEVGSPQSSNGDIFTPDEGIRIFIHGESLSKSDLDVQNALEEVTIDPMLYPHIHMWKREMMSCTKEEINSLSTPRRSWNPFLSDSERKLNCPKSEPSKRYPEIPSTPVNTVDRRDGWRTAPNKCMVNPQNRPKNFYDCLQSLEEGAD